VGQALRDSPEAQDEMLSTLAKMYWAVGSDDESAAMQLQRIDVRRKLYGDRDVRVAEAILDYSRALWASTDRGKVSALLQQARQIIDAAPRVDVEMRVELLEITALADMYVAITDMRDQAHAARILIEQSRRATREFGEITRLEARADFALGDWAEAVHLHERSLADARTPAHEDIGLQVTNLLEEAEVHASMAHVQKAESLYRQALQLSLARNGASHVDTLHAQTRLAQFLSDTARVPEARELRKVVVQAVGRSKGADTPNIVGQVEKTSGRMLLDEGQLEAAAPFIANDVALRRRLYPGSAALGSALYNQACLEMLLGHFEEAERRLTEGQATVRAALGAARKPVTDNRFRLLRAQLLIAEGKAAPALEELSAVVAPSSADVTLDVYAVAATAWRAAAYLHLGDASRALATADTAMQILQRSPVRGFYQRLEADVELRLGQAQLQAGDAQAARIALMRALDLRTANDDPVSPWIAEIDVALAECELSLLRKPSAHELLERAARIVAAHKELGTQFTAPLRRLRPLV
jgi:tetratricopeptide (TPR) repeat protein